MLIQPRDREILKICYEQRFLFLEHIERYFFKATDTRNARERILEMERAGWIRRERIAGLGTKRIIRLTSEGTKIAQSSSRANIPQHRRLDLNTLNHDAIVTSVALRLKELWDGTWCAERSLPKADYPHLPDGVFIFESGKRVVIEVENSQKGRSRFLSILESWRRADVLLVLFLATSPEIFKALQGYLTEGAHRLPFGLVQWRELEEGAPFIWTPNGELDLFSRRDL